MKRVGPRAADFVTYFRLRNAECVVDRAGATALTPKQMPHQSSVALVDVYSQHGPGRWMAPLLQHLQRHETLVDADINVVDVWHHSLEKLEEQLQRSREKLSGSSRLIGNEASVGAAVGEVSQEQLGALGVGRPICTKWIRVWRQHSWVRGSNLARPCTHVRSPDVTFVELAPAPAADSASELKSRAKPHATRVARRDRRRAADPRSSSFADGDACGIWGMRMARGAWPWARSMGHGPKPNVN